MSSITIGQSIWIQRKKHGRDYELCNDCTHELNRFLKGIRMVNEQRETD